MATYTTYNHVDSTLDTYVDDVKVSSMSNVASEFLTPVTITDYSLPTADGSAGEIIAERPQFLVGNGPGP